tara:strand:+ start:64 stop:612 length:549 start_codon:yes stop_codon:yes gene_type:complete
MGRDSNKPQSSLVGSAGEHLVLSKLLIKNYIAALAPEFTKSYDIIVLNKDGTSSFPIQVKSSYDSNYGWILSQKNEEPIKNLFYAFVDFQSSEENPNIYIIDSPLVAKLVKTSHQIYLKVPGRKGQKHNDTPMRRLAYDFKNTWKNTSNLEKYLNKQELTFLNKYSNGWLDEYKDAWHLIKE